MSQSPTASIASTGSKRLLRTPEALRASRLNSISRIKTALKQYSISNASRIWLLGPRNVPELSPKLNRQDVSRRIRIAVPIIGFDTEYLEAGVAMVELLRPTFSITQDPETLTGSLELAL